MNYINSVFLIYRFIYISCVCYNIYEKLIINIFYWMWPIFYFSIEPDVFGVIPKTLNETKRVIGFDEWEKNYCCSDDVDLSICLNAKCRYNMYSYIKFCFERHRVNQVYCLQLFVVWKKEKVAWSTWCPLLSWRAHSKNVVVLLFWSKT